MTLAEGAREQEVSWRRWLLHPGHLDPTHHGRPSQVAGAIASLGLWWRGMRADAADFESQCLLCAQMRGTNSPSGVMLPERYQKLFECIFFERKGEHRPHGPSGGTHALTLCCGLSDAATTARVIYEEVVLAFGAKPAVYRADGRDVSRTF